MPNQPLIPELTVAFCTRDREPSLRVALQALMRDLVRDALCAEVLVVDDGRMGAAVVSSLAADVARHGLTFTFLSKPCGDTGLYGSRRLAARSARAPLLLFLDDDADVATGYCRSVVSTFAELPDVVGVGGIDRMALPEGMPPLGGAYARLFRLSGDGPGRLSATGMNHSQSTWRLQSERFDTEYLHGCNMAFRTEVVRDLPPLPWLVGHSPCEDLALSAFARQRGRLIVDPALQVNHRHVPGGRGDPRQGLLASLKSRRAFSRTFRPCAWPIFAWSVTGLFLKDFAKACLTREAAVIRGTLSAYVTFATSRHGAADA